MDNYTIYLYIGFIGISAVGLYESIRITRLRKDFNDLYDKHMKLMVEYSSFSESAIERMKVLEKQLRISEKKRTMWDTFPKDENGKPIIN